MNYFCTVKGLVFYRGKFLIIRRSDHARGDLSYWELPGGRVDFHEDPHHALLREVREETGLDVAFRKVLTMWTYPKNKGTHVFGTTSELRALSDRVNLSREHTDFRWITFEEVMEFAMHPRVAKELDSMKYQYW